MSRDRATGNRAGAYRQKSYTVTVVGDISEPEHLGMWVVMRDGTIRSGQLNVDSLGLSGETMVGEMNLMTGIQLLAQKRNLTDRRNMDECPHLAGSKTT